MFQYLPESHRVGGLLTYALRNSQGPFTAEGRQISVKLFVNLRSLFDSECSFLSATLTDTASMKPKFSPSNKTVLTACLVFAWRSFLEDIGLLIFIFVSFPEAVIV
jgi:hypothetical protein